MKFDNTPETSVSQFNTPVSHASRSQPPPSQNNSSVFGFEHMDALSHLQRIEAMQAAHREEQERKKVEEEEQKRLDLELFGEAEEDVQMTTEAGGPGGELVLENPDKAGDLVLENPEDVAVEREDTVMADAGVPVPKPEEPEEPPLPPPECFVNAPQPGAFERKGCTTKIAYGKRAACEVLGNINVNAKHVAAVVTSYSDGFVVLALISPPWETFDIRTQSAAALLFTENDQPSAPRVAAETKEPESAVIDPETAMPSPTKSVHEEVAAFTGFYYGHKKVGKLLDRLTLAEDPVAVLSRTTSSDGMAIFLIGKQKTSPPAEDAIDISHEVSEIQYEARMAYIETGGKGEALDSELESLHSDDDGNDGTDEPLSPQSAGRGNKPTFLMAMAAQTPKAAPKRGTGGAKKGGGGRGRGRAGSKTRGRK